MGFLGYEKKTIRIQKKTYESKKKLRGKKKLRIIML